MSANTFSWVSFRRLWPLSFGMTAGCPGTRMEAVNLKPGRVLTFHKAGSIKVLEGVIWLTGTPADRDVILQSGEGFELKDNQPFVAEALTETGIIMFQV
jgi:hypothetical protein